MNIKKPHNSENVVRMYETNKNISKMTSSDFDTNICLSFNDLYNKNCMKKVSLMHDAQNVSNMNDGNENVANIEKND